MWRLALASLLCASCNQIFGLNQTHQEPADGGASDACTTSGCACTESSQCSSLVCVVSVSDASGSGAGTCADPSTVAYVAVPPLGAIDNTQCAQAAPCSTVATALATKQSLISISGVFDESVRIAKDVDVYGSTPDAALSGSGGTGAPIVELTAAKTVTLHDLTIANATIGAGGSGVGVVMDGGGDLTLIHCDVSQNQGLGVFAGAGGTISVLRSSIAGNRAGGLDLTSNDVTLSNDFIVNNGGTPAGPVGGVRLEDGVSVLVFEYNTVCTNTSESTSPDKTGGIACDLGAEMLKNSIIAGNSGFAGTGSAPVPNNDVFGCATDATYFGPDIGQFNFMSSTDFHIGSASAALGKAQQDTIHVDVDGDFRPQHLDPDQGADERVDGENP